jgi:hypothetical protein
VQVRVGDSTVAREAVGRRRAECRRDRDALPSRRRAGTEPARFAALVGLRHVEVAPVLRERPEGSTQR